MRDNPPTRELQDSGGRSPLRAGFKKGGPAKHFHVHKHFHAKGGKTRTVSHSYAAAEKHAETFAEGGHVHDDTSPPAGGPDFKKGGKTRPVKKNAGGALYATGGTINKLALGGVPMSGTPAAGALGRLAMRPQGLPTRAGPALRRPMPMPGPSPLARAKGGTVPAMERVAKKVVREHINYPEPQGHKGLGAALKRR
jgi:hypothetical protein